MIDLDEGVLLIVDLDKSNTIIYEPTNKYFPFGW